MTDPWWQTFFNGLAAQTVPALYSAAQTELEAEFLERHLGLRPGDAVLDAPCGGGRLSVALASRGFRLTGIDISPELVSTARASAAGITPEPRFEVADMLALDVDGGFDAGFCFGNSFAYFDDAGNERFLRSMATVLKPGARFAVDTLCAETILPHIVPRRWFRLAGTTMLSETRFDAATATLATEYTFLRGGAEETKQARYRIYGLKQLVDLLTACGFASVEAYSDTDGTRFAFGARRLVLVATR